MRSGARRAPSLTRPEARQREEAGTALLRAIGKGELSTQQHARVIEAGTGGAPIEFISDRRERQMIGELKRLLFELGHGDAVVLTQNLARFATFH